MGIVNETQLLSSGSPAGGHQEIIDLCKAGRDDHLPCPIQSHHKKPIKATVPKSHLYVTEGCLSEEGRTFSFAGKKTESPAPAAPWRQMLHHPFTSQFRSTCSSVTVKVLIVVEEQSRKTHHHRRGIRPCWSYCRRSDRFLQPTAGLISRLTSLTFFFFFCHPPHLGSLVAISLSKVVGDDVVAIDGHGTMHMRLCQSTYQTLGLSGRRSKFGPPGQNFVVEIDMLDPAMRPGTAVYERTRKLLATFPASIFNDMVAPKHERRGRHWDVLMAWVDEQGSLQPINSSLLAPTTTVKTCVAEIETEEKLVCRLKKPETPEGYLELYEGIGESMLSTSERTRGEVSGWAISARGFFHPMKLAELSVRLLGSYRMVSLTGHTFPSAPFSFMTLRQTHKAVLPAGAPPAKKVKKGKGAMLGPERASDAGPSSWTFVALDPPPAQLPNQASPVPSHISTQHPSSDHQSVAHNPPDLIFRKHPPSLSVGRPWIVFESVGTLDTHC
ncbi:hypothetical protein VP01_1370g3 [Puccinia sorghi]|uniref:Uncharacterized protein n=1 Tax=Puccinia sorghi TaxID=27349 RepID=A0A0L6VNI3_9BASI|nr:hypothetical protein VP01_1370g3 [Puccinia sorghi]